MRGCLCGGAGPFEVGKAAGLRAVDAVLGNLAVAGEAEVVEALHLGSHCGG